MTEIPNGKRIIELRAAEKEQEVLRLHELGYSYRQIKEELKFKSSTSVVYYLAKKKEK